MPTVVLPFLCDGNFGDARFVQKKYGFMALRILSHKGLPHKAPGAYNTFVLDQLHDNRMNDKISIGGHPGPTMLSLEFFASYFHTQG